MASGQVQTVYGNDKKRFSKPTKSKGTAWKQTAKTTGVRCLECPMAFAVGMDVFYDGHNTIHTTCLRNLMEKVNRLLQGAGISPVSESEVEDKYLTISEPASDSALKALLNLVNPDEKFSITDIFIMLCYIRIEEKVDLEQETIIRILEILERIPRHLKKTKMQGILVSLQQ